MKLIEEHKEHQSIYYKGFRFNPEDQTFFTSNLKSFKLPEGYDEWKIVQIDRDKYLKERLKELGISKKQNSVELIDKDGMKVQMPIFVSNDHGDIEIMQYSLKGLVYTYDKETTSAGTRTEYHVRTRLNPIYEPFCEGKYDGSESKNVPFWPPQLLKAFQEEKEVDTLIITEGQFKAWKGSQQGLYVVGFNSINHFKDKRTGGIHPEVIEFCKTCNVKKVVVLWDGDCLNISSKHLIRGEELSLRPAGFFNYARSIKRLIQKFLPPRKLKIYFATIKTDQIENNPKGLDDLLCEKDINSKDILIDFSRVGDSPSYFIDWIDITNNQGEKNLRAFFKLHSVNDFYQYHQEQIQHRSFVYFGTTFRIQEGVPVVEIDKDLKNYLRIGPDYFRKVMQGSYNEDGEKVREDEILAPWKFGEITRDFGKNALDNVTKLDGFCNIPNHINYNQIIDNKWNLYSDIKHESVPGEWPTIEGFLKHIFQEQYEMGLDYIQLLYSKPFQKLPVLGLVSKEEGTGKSTFLKLLYMIFQNNMTYVTPEDILGQWSSHWVSKLLVASEETFFEKKEALEKIKNISTADKIMRSERFVNNTLIDCFVKFVFCSNHEDDFIKLNAGASRFWIIKVQKIAKDKKDTELNTKMMNELPHFIEFIQNRNLAYEKKDRMWFEPELYKTEAFKNIVKHSEPGIIKELRAHLTEMFLVNGDDKIHMSTKDLKTEFGIRQEHNYINKSIQSYFNVERITDDKGNSIVTTYSYRMPHLADPDELSTRKRKGRPFVFNREDFVIEDKQAQLKIV